MLARRNLHINGGQSVVEDKMRALRPRQHDERAAVAERPKRGLACGVRVTWFFSSSRRTIFSM